MTKKRPQKKDLPRLRRRTALSCVLALSLAAISPAVAQSEHAGEPVAAAPRASYDATVLEDRPSAYWTMGSPRKGTEKDQTGNKHTGTYFGRPAATTLPNGDTAADFDGKTEYLQVKDAAALSPATRGVLTLEAWMRPDDLDFPEKEDEKGYLHWMGKGESGKHEYVARFYSKTDTERKSRISGYLFNASGGKGAGSYFQEKVTKGAWIHYVLVINANKKSKDYPNGYTRIYRNGKTKKEYANNLDYRGTVIVPTRGTAPFRVATRDLNSFFEGAIGKVAIYGKELSQKRIEQHYKVMTQR
jgi:hypothetical protein